MRTANEALDDYADHDKLYPSIPRCLVENWRDERDRQRAYIARLEERLRLNGIQLPKMEGER